MMIFVNTCIGFPNTVCFVQITDFNFKFAGVHLYRQKILLLQ